MNKRFQNGDLIEGIAATPRVPAATASTSKGKSLVSPFWTLIFSLTPLPETIVYNPVAEVVYYPAAIEGLIVTIILS